MEKQFVSFEIALQLKELGSSDNCFAYYNINRSLCIYQQEDPSITIEQPDTIVEAPLYQQAEQFLRDNFNVYATCQLTDDYDPSLKTWYIDTYDMYYGGDSEIKHLSHWQSFNTYEQAREKSIELLII